MEQAARVQTIKRLQADHDRLNTRIETMYMDELDGRITAEFFDQRSAAWRGERDALLWRLQDIQKATRVPVAPGGRRKSRVAGRKAIETKRRYLGLGAKWEFWRPKNTVQRSLHRNAS
ncbi:MAG TPA: hypothetical protein VN924_20735 [Bryobacteraceae bacterium]|nr:hypothetical protein [Bryobacteraceae bacterium]